MHLRFVNQDRNYEEKDVKIELTGYHRGKLPIEGQKTEIVNGQYIKLPDFERTKEKDDLYTLTVQVTDRAGNVTKKSNYIFGKFDLALSIH